VEDKLFATLDAATRVLAGRRPPVLLIDTVGFIRRLPHDLVDAFRSTLEEVSRADILIHVLDASDNDVDRYYETTRSVLKDLEAETIPVITVLNKIDRLESPERLLELRQRYPEAVALSARDHTGLEDLTGRIDALLDNSLTRFSFPPARTDLAALLYRSGRVVSEKYEDNSIEMEAQVERRVSEQLREFVVVSQGPIPGSAGSWDPAAGPSVRG
jgi:GTP-binding protein HflX